jgi:hypothetical protein
MVPLISSRKSGRQRGGGGATALVEKEPAIVGLEDRDMPGLDHVVVGRPILLIRIRGIDVLDVRLFFGARRSALLRTK